MEILSRKRLASKACRSPVDRVSEDCAPFARAEPVKLNASGIAAQSAYPKIRELVASAVTICSFRVELTGKYLSVRAAADVCWFWRVVMRRQA